MNLIESKFTKDTRVPNALDDVASNIRQALPEVAATVRSGAPRLSRSWLAAPLRRAIEDTHSTGIGARLTFRVIAQLHINSMSIECSCSITPLPPPR